VIEISLTFFRSSLSNDLRLLKLFAITIKESPLDNLNAEFGPTGRRTKCPLEDTYVLTGIIE
jgi:hypothetical protein